MKYLFLLLVIGFSFQGVSQEITVDLLSKTPLEKVKFIGVDKYGSLYTVQKNQLIKKAKDQTYNFSAIGLGTLTSVDILNPLKLVLYYENVNIVILLDDRLNEMNRIDFNTINDFKTTGFVTKAEKDNLWIFNVDNRELEVFDYKQKRVLYNTQPVEGKILSQKSNFNFCWILTDKKLSQYNAYGSLTYEIPVENISDISYYNKYILAKSQNKLMLLHEKEHLFYPINISEIDIAEFYSADENLYIYDGNFLYKFALKLTN